MKTSKNKWEESTGTESRPVTAGGWGVRAGGDFLKAAGFPFGGDGNVVLEQQIEVMDAG